MRGSGNDYMIVFIDFMGAPVTFTEIEVDWVTITEVRTGYLVK